MQGFLLMLLALSVGQCSQLENDSITLENILCKGDLKSDQTFNLSSDQIIGPGLKCFVSDLHNINITGNNFDVSCHFGSSFTFSKITSLKITGLIFRDCGSVLNESFYPTAVEVMRAVLYFENCTDVTLDQITLAGGNAGIGIIGVNIKNNFIIKNSAISQKLNSSLDGGILLYYDDDIGTDNNSTVLIASTNLVDNVFTKTVTNSCVYYDSSHFPYTGSALTIMLNQSFSTVNVTVEHCNISNNTGNLAGGIVIGFYYDTDRTMMNIYNTYFTKNFISSTTCTGSSIQITMFNNERSENEWENIFSNENHSCKYPLYLSNAIVNDHQQTPIYITTVKASNRDRIIIFSNVTFANNHGNGNGICLLAEGVYNNYNTVTKTQIIFKEVIAYNNTPNILPFHSASPLLFPPVTPAIFSFVNLDSVSIKCHSNANITCTQPTFYNNDASVFKGSSTDFFLDGYLVFNKNKATIGTAFQLHSFSHIFLAENVTVQFSNNLATAVGGAIAASLTDNDDTMCLIQIECKQNCLNLSELFNISFVNNSAELGRNIYGSPLFVCRQVQYFRSPVDPFFYEHIFHWSFNWSSIVTNPLFVRFCNCEAFNCSKIANDPWFSKINLNTHPGSIVHINVEVFNNISQRSYSVPTRIFAYIQSGVNDQENTLSQYEFQYNHQNDTCQKFSFRVFGIEDSNFQIALAPPNVQFEWALSINVSLNKCPLGFSMNKSLSCSCSKFIKLLNRHTVKNGLSKGVDNKDIVCEISKGATLSRPNQFWLGNVTSENCLGFSAHCLTGYCHPVFGNNKMTSFSLTKTDSLCAGGRTGTLCGACPEHLSVVFGSNKCMPCSNLYLLSIVGYAAGGLVLVAAMYLLKLTLNHGTIGGVIFYANILERGLLYLLDMEVIQVSSSSVAFISLLNVRVCFAACFYEKMTDLVKISLQFAYPVYIWLIVGVIVIVSRYSVRVSNLTSDTSVQVIVTLVHLTFAKLLLTVIEIYSFSWIVLEPQVNNSNFSMDNNESETSIHTIAVWFRDGNVKFGVDKFHLFLLIVATLFLILILLPYLVIVTLAPFRYGCRLVSRFKPFFDTIYGPYKDDMRYFFGLRQCIIFITYGLYGVTNAYSVLIPSHIVVTILMLLLLMQVWCKPFKSWYINVLDCWYIFNAIITVVIGMHFIIREMDYQLVVLKALLHVMNTLAFITFCLTLVYHVSLVLNLMSLAYHCWTTYVKKLKRLQNVFSQISNNESEFDNSVQSNYGSTLPRNSTQYVSLRESLLSSGEYSQKVYRH